MRATVWRGSSEPYGSWNTIWKSRRAVRSSAFESACRLRPSSATLPEVGVSSAITRRAMVDLPEPDSPTMPTLLPACTLKLTPLSAFTVGGGPKSFSRGNA
ncbi:hypothetical protein D3C85_1323810 [compost metagenome]